MPDVRPTGHGGREPDRRRRTPGAPTTAAVGEAARAAAGEVARFLRTEQVGGFMLLAATLVAMIAANSPLRDAYNALGDFVIGPAALHLDLDVETWAADGLLAVFFVVVGLELKRELVVGELRDPRRAMLPVFGAIGGMIIPVVVFLAVAAGSPGADQGWAIPVATDIAFALAILAVTARALPSSLRVFLLTLAIVDDLGAISVITIVFTDKVAFLPLVGALATVAVYALLQRARFRGPWLYLPLALLTWLLVHEAGVHATVAGVMIGLATRVTHDPGERESPARRLEHTLQPISAGVCVPLFAFFAAGVPLSGPALGAFATDRVALGIVAGLVIGKTLGVLGGSALAVRLRLARLPDDIGWHDLIAVSVLTGCGFTVSLLIAELAFRGTAQEDLAKAAVLTGSLVASLLAATLLRRRVSVHR